MANITLADVGKYYHGKRGLSVRAVSNLNLEVKDREFLVLAGPSGCGKSTILRLIAGLESVSEGQISIADRVVNHLPARSRDVAMVFQNFSLYPHLTVRENLAFGLKMRKTPADEISKRIKETAAWLGIENLLQRKPGSLSGGERQRVALGRAVVRRPQVFLFDEPLSNLDAQTRAQIRVEIIKLHQRLQTTMIYVTHDQVEALTMADRVAVMANMENPETGRKEGFIQQIGEPLKVYHEPRNLFVAGFLGCPQMNFIRGIVRQKDAALFFEEAQRGVVRLKLEGTAARVLLDREVILGVRPEDVKIEGLSLDETFPGVVTIIEMAGADTNIHLDTGAHTLVSRMIPAIEHGVVGSRLRFQIHPNRVHFFDPISTLRIV